MKKFLIPLLFLALIALAGCAQKGQPLVPADTASERWQAFASNESYAGTYGVLSGSLRFGPTDNTHRVTYTLWSDLPSGASNENGKANSRNIRLEISAGIGGHLASLGFADGRMLLLLPKEGRVYIGTSSNHNLKKLLGLSLPLEVQDLNDFLAGRLFSALDAPLPERYETGEDGGIVYHYKTKGGSAELTLDARALPVRWKERDGWEMEIAFTDDGLPSKISGRLHAEDGEQRLVLLAKERSPLSSVQASGSGLRIPAGFTVYSLD